MKPECADAVNAVAGRKLTKAEHDAIESEIRGAARAEAQKNPEEWRNLSESERSQRAAQAAMDSLEAQQAKKQQRVGLTIAAHDRVGKLIEEWKAQGRSGLETMRRMMMRDADQNSGVVSLETKKDALVHNYMRGLEDSFDNISPKFFGLLSRPENERALVYEIFGHDSAKEIGTDPALAKILRQGAEVWKQNTDAMRERFNRNGGSIGKLEDWNTPQGHDQRLVAKAGFEPWYKFIRPLLDDSKYIDIDGHPMTDGQMQDFLREANKSMATGGANKIEPGKFSGNGMAANRFNEHRYIHFKGPEEYITYMKKFGNTSDILSAMQNHIHSMTKDIARVEMFGPNADATVKYFLDKELKDETLKSPEDAQNIKTKAAYVQSAYDEASGKRIPIYSQKVANFFGMYRQDVLANKLGGASISSIPHQVPFQLTGWSDNLPQMKLLKTFFKNLVIPDKDRDMMMKQNALSTKYTTGSLSRFTNDEIMPSFLNKAAKFVTASTGLNHINEIKYSTFGANLSSEMARIVKEHGSLAEASEEARYLKGYGTTDAHFNVWKKAAAEDWGDMGKVLTLESVYGIPDAKLEKMGDPATLRDDAAMQLLSIVTAESDIAANAPSLQTRMLTRGVDTKGFPGGEAVNQIWKSFWALKMYPLGMLQNQYRRAMSMPTLSGKAYYVGTMIAGTTLLGALQLQIKSLISGKNPAPMDDPYFWMASLLSGGSWGLFGDFLLDPSNNGDRSIGARVAGPALETLNDIGQATSEAISGHWRHMGAMGIGLAKNLIPGMNIWYLRAALNRFIFNNLQEMVNPGYAGRQEEQAAKSGQTFWLHPGGGADTPDLSTALRKR